MQDDTLYKPISHIVIEIMSLLDSTTPVTLVQLSLICWFSNGAVRRRLERYRRLRRLLGPRLSILYKNIRIKCPFVSRARCTLISKYSTKRRIYGATVIFNEMLAKAFNSEYLRQHRFALTSFTVWFYTPINLCLLLGHGHTCQSEWIIKAKTITAAPNGKGRTIYYKQCHVGEYGPVPIVDELTWLRPESTQHHKDIFISKIAATFAICRSDKYYGTYCLERRAWIS